LEVYYFIIHMGSLDKDDRVILDFFS
jgi:hypothetical protein